MLRQLPVRFACLYFFLYALPFPVDALLPADTGLTDWYDTRWDPVVTWVGRLLGVTDGPLTLLKNGSGDRLGHYVQLLCYAVLALVGALVWLAVDRRRPADRIFAALYLWLRYLLATAMMSYGIVKVIPLQFPYPSPFRFIQPYGESSPMGLLWTFMGASPAYTMLAGAAEILGGTLLLFRRTTTLGALILVGVIGNVVALNFCYDVCVKQYSLHLFAMAVLLVLPEMRRLVVVLVLGRAAPPAVLPAFTLPVRRSLWVTAKVLFIAGIVHAPLSAALARWQEHGTGQPRTPQWGVYEIAELRRDGVVVPPRLDDPDYWRVAAFNDFEGRIRVGDPARRLVAVPDFSRGTIRLGRPGKPPQAVLALTRAASGELTIDGDFEGHRLVVKLRRAPPHATYLHTRGFHWVNDFPHNR